MVAYSAEQGAWQYIFRCSAGGRFINDPDRIRAAIAVHQGADSVLELPLMQGVEERKCVPQPASPARTARKAWVLCRGRARHCFSGDVTAVQHRPRQGTLGVRFRDRLVGRRRVEQRGRACCGRRAAGYAQRPCGAAAGSVAGRAAPFACEPWPCGRVRVQRPNTSRVHGAQSLVARSLERNGGASTPRGRPVHPCGDGLRCRCQGGRSRSRTGGGANVPTG